MADVSKQDVVDAVADATGSSKADANKAVDAVNHKAFNYFRNNAPSQIFYWVLNKPLRLPDIFPGISN